MKYFILFAAVIGFANFTTINHSAFQAMAKTIITQKGKNIPSRLMKNVTEHHWRLIPKTKEEKKS